MRTVQVTGGYSGSVSGRFKDDRGADLSTNTAVKVALVDPEGTIPSSGAAAWVTPVVDSAGVGFLAFHFTVNGSNPVGEFLVVGQVTVGGVTELVWSDDYVRLL